MQSVLRASAIAIALATTLPGCGSSDSGSAGKPTPGTPATSLPTATVGVGNAIVTTNDTQGSAPKPGALDRLANGEQAGDEETTGRGRDSLIAGSPDTGILDELPQPAGLGAATNVCAAASASPSSGNLAQVKRAVLCLLNAQRTSRGLRALKLNGKLTKAAIGHSKNMVAKHYFAHDGPDGSPLSRIKKAGYIPRVGLWTVGENLAYGTGTFAAASAIMKSWMNSPPHKANILTRGFKEIGIGIVAQAPTSGGSGATFTTTFGSVRLH